MAALRSASLFSSEGAHSTTFLPRAVTISGRDERMVQAASASMRSFRASVTSSGAMLWFPRNSWALVQDVQPFRRYAHSIMIFSLIWWVGVVPAGGAGRGRGEGRRNPSLKGLSFLTGVRYLIRSTS